MGNTCNADWKCSFKASSGASEWRTHVIIGLCDGHNKTGEDELESDQQEDRVLVVRREHTP